MKRWQAYLISVLFSMMLLAGGAYVLIRSGLVHFEWSDQLMRKQAYEEARESDRRILVLGDSQLEWWPVEPCLYNAIKDYCAERNIGYINAAHHGFGPIEYLDQLRHVAADYKPNLIMVFMYVGNDLTDIVFRHDKKPAKRTYQVAFPELYSPPNPTETEPVFQPKKQDIVGKDSSKMPDFDWEYMADRGISPKMIQYAKNRLENPHEIGEQYVNPHLLVLGTWHPDFITVNLTGEKLISSSGWYFTFRKLHGILHLADSIGSNVCLIAIPSTVQVDTSHFDFYRQLKFDLRSDLVYANTPQKNLYTFAVNNGIPFVDLLPHFKVYEKSQELYFHNDDHLSAAGHALAFEVVRKKLLDRFHEATLDTIFGSGVSDYLEYKEDAIHYKMKDIENDDKWYQEIQRKARENGLPIDSQLHLDAEFVLDAE